MVSAQTPTPQNRLCMPVKIKKPTKPAPNPPTMAKSAPSTEEEDDFFASGPTLTKLQPSKDNNTTTQELDEDDEELDEDDEELDEDDDENEHEDLEDDENDDDDNNHSNNGRRNTDSASANPATSVRPMAVTNPNSGMGRQSTEPAQPPPTQLEQQNQDVTLLQQKRRLPKVPSLRPSFKDAVAWHAKLTPLQREHVTVYVYRTYPIIIKSDPKYIDIIVEPFTVQHIEDTHGGGKYTFYFLDTDLPKNNQLFGATLEIDINFRAPILDYTELDVTHAKNRSYVALLKRDGVLTMEGKVKETEKPNASNDAVTMKLVDALLADKSAINQGRTRQGDELGTVMAKAMDMVTNTIRTSNDANSPDKMLSMMKTIMEMNKPAPVTNNDSTLTNMFMMMMKMQADSHAQMVEILKSQNANSQSSETTDPLDQLEKIAAVAEKLGFSRRNPPPVPKDTLDKVLEYGAPVLQGVLGIIQQQLSLPGSPRPAVAPLPPMPKAVGMIDDGPTIDAHGQQSNPQPQPPTDDQEMIQFHMLLNQYGAVILSHMDGLEKTGDMFADALVGMVGMPTYNMVASSGPDKLYSAMKSHKEFWSKASLYGETYLAEFCRTFCLYPELLRQEQLQDQQDMEALDPEPQTKPKKKPGVN